MDTISRKPSFQGEGGALFGIYLVSALLSIVTLGIYSFWGRTKVRQYVWGQTEFEGDRFAYHGTGKELLVGYLKVMALFVGLFILIALLVPALGAGGQVLAPIVFWLVVLSLMPVAIIGARRYRLSRTSWRGIRFSLRASTGAFVRLYLGGLFLSLLTLGLYSPIFQTKVRKFVTEHAYFGTARFGFDGEGRELFPVFLKALLLAIVTLGIYGFWYLAERERYYWSHTTLGAARFRSSITGGALLGLAVTNLLLVIFTLGIGAAWVMVRTRRFVCDNLALEGPVELAAIRQDAQAATATAEGLSDVLDTGGLDVGL
jgi:uncharacterized membrane protein YjgN (DUF898 family)